MDVAWDTSGTEEQLFTVSIRVFTEDRSGMLADISNAISDTKTNIQNLKATVNDSMGILDIVLQIRTIDHLNKILRILKKIRGVINIERIS